jgi:alkylhydroperoxidase/carboxymuconolactone decarboxylase family protein YurZ
MTYALRRWPRVVPPIIAVCLLIQTAPPIRADGCGDAGGPAADCSQPAPPWLAAIQQRDPQFADSYLGTRERILKDGAIPAKYKLLMGMITDAIAAHPDGVRLLANNARAAGASEAEVTEAVEVGYLYGGTAALVMGVNAFS